MSCNVRIVERGGLVLWNSAKNDDEESEKFIDRFISDVLLNGRNEMDSRNSGPNDLTIKCSFDNEYNLLFIGTYFSFSKLLYVDELLECVKRKFVNVFETTLKGGIGCMCQEHYDFDSTYDQISHTYVKDKSIHKTKSVAKLVENTIENGRKPVVHEAKMDSLETDDDFFEFSKRSRIRLSVASKSNKPNVKNHKNKKKKKDNGKKNKKQMRDWSVSGGISSKKLTIADIAALNVGPSVEKSDNDCKDNDNNKFNPNGDSSERDVNLQLSDSDESNDGIENNNFGIDNNSKNDSGNWIWSRFRHLISDKALCMNDLESSLKDLEKLLTEKNVSNMIAREICQSVSKQLIGKKIGAFDSIYKLVRKSITESLENILNEQKNRQDSTSFESILSGIHDARINKRPYSIIFVGVNGVGKSTSLAKVINYLQSRNLQVSVAACDTFRSGAIEQLKTHCRALNARLYEQGYARDAASVAYNAILEAKNVYHDDVILIDTAGRMQNNEKLMKSLVNLINKSKPDVILFVGEALVGNDGISQLNEFNKALLNYSSNYSINGIVLTKFDTVDDKVGAAISMTYTSGKPIVFIGTGQTYSDLKRMHIKTIVNKLLK